MSPKVYPTEGEEFERIYGAELKRLRPSVEDWLTNRLAGVVQIAALIKRTNGISPQQAFMRHYHGESGYDKLEDKKMAGLLAAVHRARTRKATIESDLALKRSREEAGGSTETGQSSGAGSSSQAPSSKNSRTTASSISTAASANPQSDASKKSNSKKQKKQRK